MLEPWRGGLKSGCVLWNLHGTKHLLGWPFFVSQKYKAWLVIAGEPLFTWLVPGCLAPNDL